MKAATSEPPAKPGPEPGFLRPLKKVRKPASGAEQLCPHRPHEKTGCPHVKWGQNSSIKSWGYMRINLMSPLSPRKNSQGGKDAAVFDAPNPVGGGLSGTPEGVPCAGELGGGYFRVAPICQGGDNWPGAG